MFKVTEFGRQALRPPDIDQLNAEILAFTADRTPEEMQAKLLEDIPKMSLEKAERVLEMALSLPLLAGESWQARGEVITLARSVVELKRQKAAQWAKPSSTRRPVRRRRR